MTRSRPTRRFAMAIGALVLALVAGACGSGDDADDNGTTATVDSSTPGANELVAQVASYDLVAGSPGRFLVGLLAADQSRLVSFGTVELQFAFVDDDPEAVNPEPSGPPVTATFLPIPGQKLDAAATGPRFVQGSEGIGVYSAPGVTFDKPGFWRVTATADVDGKEGTATAAFEVVADSPLPNVGDPAPRTENPLAGAAGVDARSIDSRAGDGGVPDAELHATTVAAALDAKKPLMVVVSTPTYCQSRFCGPITDSVAALAGRFGDRMAFVHLEVWKNFDAQEINKSAAEWIYPPGTKDAREPFVFVVGRDGRITHRFDNVAGDAELEQAATQVTA